MFINSTRLTVSAILALSLLIILAVASASNAVFAQTQAQPTVLITGANRGIGLEFAKQLKARGYKVIGTARSPAKADALKKLGAQVEQLDVTDADSVAALGERLAGVQIDILINNAGVIGDGAATLETLDFDRIQHTFAVNTFGPMRVTQALYKNMRDSDVKKIIHISSTLGSIENSSGGRYDYRASKAALNMLNKSLALELAKEGFVSVVLHPGWVKTDLGGAAANLTTDVSVGGMVKVIDKLDRADNARFIDYQGNELPW